VIPLTYPEGRLSPPSRGTRAAFSTETAKALWAGEHLQVVQERLGHHSFAFTSDTYTHVVPGMDETATARFDDLVFGIQQDSPDTRDGTHGTHESECQVAVPTPRCPNCQVPVPVRHRGSGTCVTPPRPVTGAGRR